MKYYLLLIANLVLAACLYVRAFELDEAWQIIVALFLVMLNIVSAGIYVIMIDEERNDRRT